MNTSLSNNKKLLRKKSLFKKEKSFHARKKEYRTAADGAVILEKATTEQLIAIRQKILKERRKKLYINIAIGLLFFILTGFLVFQEIEKSIVIDERNEKIKLKKQNEKYLYFIGEGDKWLEQSKWHNAIFQYKKALEIFPNEYDINYRLAYTFSLRCKYENNDCFKAKEQLDKLTKQFPKKQELLELKEIINLE